MSRSFAVGDTRFSRPPAWSRPFSCPITRRPGMVGGLIDRRASPRNAKFSWPQAVTAMKELACSQRRNFSAAQSGFLVLPWTSNSSETLCCHPAEYPLWLFRCRPLISYYHGRCLRLLSTYCGTQQSQKGCTLIKSKRACNFRPPRWQWFP